MFLIHLQMTNLGVVINLKEVHNHVKIICIRTIIRYYQVEWVTLICPSHKTLGSTSLNSLIASYIVKLEMFD